jgi:hypothetical protein
MIASTGWTTSTGRKSITHGWINRSVCELYPLGRVTTRPDRPARRGHRLDLATIRVPTRSGVVGAWLLLGLCSASLSLRLRSRQDLWRATGHTTARITGDTIEA